MEQAVKTLEEGDSVLDLCTGSGAIAVAIACEAAKDKSISVTATDISDDALDVGEDGLDFYRRIAERLHRHLVHGGMLIVECGEDQAKEVLKIFNRCDYAMVVKDMYGKERFVKIVI